METQLTDFEQQLLAFELAHPGRDGHKEQAIRTELGLAPARYYQLLLRLAHTHAALAAEPMLVKRLLRTRAVGRLSAAA